MIASGNGKAIYLVIADKIIDEIMSGTLKAEDRLLSIRDYASLVQVNHNTVKRTYDYLSDQGLIYNQRGIGFYVAPDARKEAERLRTREVLGNEIVKLFRQLQLLGVTPGQLADRYSEFLMSNESEKHQNQ